MELKIKYLSGKITNDIPAPRYASKGAAGLDLPACIDTPLTLSPGERAIVPTGVAAALPEGYVGLAIIRSSLGYKHGISLSNSVGVIDSDYRGELKISLQNLSTESYTIHPGDRIAQLLVMQVCMPSLKVVDELPETARGTGGFGSTGK